MAEAEKKERFSVEATREINDPPPPTLPTVANPIVPKDDSPSHKIPAAVYVTFWITLSSSVILFNKWILSTKGFPFPVILTTWHLLFATFATQVMSRTTTLLDSRKKVKMNGRIYVRAIVPIGAAFSGSLICGNLTYLYLSVSFIQMLKATTPVAVLIVGWIFDMDKFDPKVLLNVSTIVIGIMIASFGEITFVLIGFVYQIAGIVFEALKLVLVERLLSGAEYKMDPLVSLYYFAPVCAVMNFFVALILEVPRITLADFENVGYMTLLANASVAFALNVSVVFLIGRTSSLVMTLCGVLKDILLVAASVMIWNTPLTPLQVFGYAIALCGLVYYKLGVSQIKAQFNEGSRKWAEYGVTHPVARKLVILGVVLTFTFILLTGLAPSVGYDPKQAISALKDSNKATTPA